MRLLAPSAEDAPPESTLAGQCGLLQQAIDDNRPKIELDRVAFAAAVVDHDDDLAERHAEFELWRAGRVAPGRAPRGLRPHRGASAPGDDFRGPVERPSRPSETTSLPSSASSPWMWSWIS